MKSMTNSDAKFTFSADDKKSENLKIDDQEKPKMEDHSRISMSKIKTCAVCGADNFIPSGSCFVCLNCGTSGGCS